MALFAFEKDPPRPASRGRRVLVRRWTDPRSLLGFSFLLTIGIAGVDLIIGLFSPGPEARVIIGAISALTIAACWAVTLVIAWFVLLFRCLVALCDAILGAPSGRSSRVKLRPRPVAPGVSDAWLDGPC
jgi:hypothetical protein